MDPPRRPSQSRINIEDSTAAETRSIDPRLQAMQKKLETLQSTLSALQAQRQALASSTSSALGLEHPTGVTSEESIQEVLEASDKVVKKRIQLLNRYNEIRDIATGLIGMVADNRQKRIINVMSDFGVGEGD